MGSIIIDESPNGKATAGLRACCMLSTLGPPRLITNVRAGPIYAQDGTWLSMEEYRAAGKPGSFDPHTFYRLANSLDRKLIRPSSWSGTYTFADIIGGLQIGPSQANGKQPSSSETNRTPQAAASRRSP